MRVYARMHGTTERYRRNALTSTGYNLFALGAEDVAVDLLSDSGTGAMSQTQLAALMTGTSRTPALDRSPGSPTRRAAEHLLLLDLLPRPGAVLPSNAFFDTTRAHTETLGARALDLRADLSPGCTGHDPDFLGNIDLDRLDALLTGADRDRVPAC